MSFQLVPIASNHNQQQCTESPTLTGIFQLMNPTATTTSSPFDVTPLLDVSNDHFMMPPLKKPTSPNLTSRKNVQSLEKKNKPSPVAPTDSKLKANKVATDTKSSPIVQVKLITSPKSLTNDTKRVASKDSILQDFLIKPNDVQFGKRPNESDYKEEELRLTKKTIIEDKNQNKPKPLPTQPQQVPQNVQPVSSNQTERPVEVMRVENDKLEVEQKKDDENTPVKKVVKILNMPARRRNTRRVPSFDGVMENLSLKIDMLSEIKKMGEIFARSLYKAVKKVETSTKLRM